MPGRIIADYGDHVGENPLWHPDEAALYWTDIPRGRLYWYDPASPEAQRGGGHTQVYGGRPVGGVTLEADGALLLFRDKGNVVRFRGGAVVDTVVEAAPGEETSRFNDVIADPEGRVFCGTMPAEGRPGRLYRLDPDGSLHKVLDGTGTPNGMGFTLDLAQMYFTDSTARTIWLFDYDRASGALTGQRPFVRIGEDQGTPDGMTVDSEGCVWSARLFDGSLRRYAPTGEELARIEIPLRSVTSLTFGGPELKDIYCTSLGGRGKDEHGEDAGAVAHLHAEVAGRPEFRSRLGG